MTSWNVSLLFVHLLALTWAVQLYKQAPCWMQKWVMAGLAAGMFVCVIGYSLAILQWWGAWNVTVSGWGISHAAGLLLIFRLRRQAWPISSPSSHNLPS